jgi:molybdopterin-binding protein
MGSGDRSHLHGSYPEAVGGRAHGYRAAGPTSCDPLPNSKPSACGHPVREFILSVLSQENPERLSESSFHLDRYSQSRYYPAMKLSARNSLVGKVEEVKLGNVMAHVVVRVGDNIIDSVITRRSAEEMGLKVGDTVAAIIKSTEVMLQKD